MGDVHVHDGVGWTNIENFHVNTGTWNQAKRVWIHNGSTWQIAWENEITETFAFSQGQTYQGSTLCSSTRCQNTLVVGESPNNNLDHNGLWVPGTGSVSGSVIEVALLNRTITSFQVTLGLSWSHVGRFNGDGVPTRVALWGTTYDGIPAVFSGTNAQYMCELAFYPNSSDYSEQRVPVTQSMLGTNPTTNGDRYPATRGNIELINYLHPNTLTALTDGTIKSFALRQYNYLGQKQDHTYYASYNEPGKSYTTSGVPATGDTNAFRIKVTHTG